MELYSASIDAFVIVQDAQLKAPPHFTRSVSFYSYFAGIGEDDAGVCGRLCSDDVSGACAGNRRHQ